MINDDATIYPGNATEVVVEVNRQEAAEEPPGTHNSTITFGAGNQYAGNTLAASLIVEPLPCHLEIDIEENELYFRIEPEGLLESETEKPIVLRNSWKTGNVIGARNRAMTGSPPNRPAGYSLMGSQNLWWPRLSGPMPSQNWNPARTE